MVFVSRDDDEDHSLHLFCYPKVSYGSLKKLTLFSMGSTENVWCDKVPIGFFTGLVELDISYVYKIRSLFSSSSMAQNLVNLQKLNIACCDEMVKVIEDEKEVSSSSSCDHLPKLESFCEWRIALHLPSLKKLEIDGCHEMKSFNAAVESLIITPALKTVSIDHEELLERVDDLNATLLQHFEKAKREREREEEEGISEGQGEIEEA